MSGKCQNRARASAGSVGGTYLPSVTSHHAGHHGPSLRPSLLIIRRFPRHHWRQHDHGTGIPAMQTSTDQPHASYADRSAQPYTERLTTGAAMGGTADCKPPKRRCNVLCQTIDATPGPHAAHTHSMCSVGLRAPAVAVPDVLHKQSHPSDSAVVCSSIGSSMSS